jgi:betaine-homocysteine S-methyltransferase
MKSGAPGNTPDQKAREMMNVIKMGILEKLAQGPVLGDGGYLLELEKRGRVRAGPFTPEVALDNPEALLELHREFRDAGSEVLQSLTFYASRDKLATVGMGDRVEELNRAAVRIARQAAGTRCIVAGTISLTWMYEPNDKPAADRVRKTSTEQLTCRDLRGRGFHHRRDIFVAWRSVARC